MSSKSPIGVDKLLLKMMCDMDCHSNWYELLTVKTSRSMVAVYAKIARPSRRFRT
jgi:hypothetical protein